jgi:23S rRNA (pseudouridine1915-N3)-methyltransferase
MMSEMDLKKKEGEMILNFLSKDDYLVVLDERGKQLSSEGLAEFIQKRGNESVKSLIFLVGGAFGIDDAILQRANFKWSLSQLVFPHQLVRLILAEQVYRACTILKNEKYHHK